MNKRELNNENKTVLLPLAGKHHKPGQLHNAGETARD